MPELLALLVGCLYAGAVYMLLRRSLFKLVLGLVLLSHATHLLVFAVGQRRFQPPIIPSGEPTLPEASADPLVQALILTAIVISFALTSFALVLVYRLRQVLGSDDVDTLRTVEP